MLRYARFLAVLGDGAYVTTSLVVNRWFNVKSAAGWATPTGPCRNG